MSKNKENIKIFLLKMFIFYNLNNLFILHGQVFVMEILKTICVIDIVYSKPASQQSLSDCIMVFLIMCRSAIETMYDTRLGSISVIMNVMKISCILS